MRVYTDKTERVMRRKQKAAILKDDIAMLLSRYLWIRAQMGVRLLRKYERNVLMAVGMKIKSWARMR